MQRGALVDTIVVFNGTALDERTVQWAQCQPRTRCVILNGPDVAGATFLGRLLVRSEFFTYLDDDDELLANAILCRIKRMREDPSLDCVATNGVYCTKDGVKPLFEQTHVYEQLGLRESLVRSKNWLHSCGGLFRTSSVKATYFYGLPQYREWTVLAYRLSCDLQCRFDDVRTYRVNDTEKSLSKRDAYVESSVEALEHMLRYTKNRAHARALGLRKSDAHRRTSSHYRINGDFARAWQSFGRAIAAPGGWRYLPYSLLLTLRVARPIGELNPLNRFRRIVDNCRHAARRLAGAAQRA